MDNPETLATLDTQDTGSRQTKQENITQKQKTKLMSNTESTIKHGNGNMLTFMVYLMRK